MVSLRLRGDLSIEGGLESPYERLASALAIAQWVKCQQYFRDDFSFIVDDCISFDQRVYQGQSLPEAGFLGGGWDLGLGTWGDLLAKREARRFYFLKYSSLRATVDWLRSLVSHQHYGVQSTSVSKE